jgi:hypothetical protein
VPLSEISQFLNTDVAVGFNSETLPGNIILEEDSNYNLNSFPGSTQRFFLYTSIGVTNIQVSSTLGSLRYLKDYTVKKEEMATITNQGYLNLKYPITPGTIPNFMVIGKPLNYGGIEQRRDKTWLVKAQDLNKNYMMVILLVDYMTTRQHWELSNTFFPLASYEIGILATGTNPLLKKSS